ncbi:MAG: helix-turn-helix domain-containing protein [Haloarculaceae archaeon]
MSQSKPWRDKETLQRLYVDENLSAHDISEKLNCSKRTITNWLYKKDIKQPSGNEPYHDEDKLRNLYVKEQLSAEDIAEKFGCSHLTVERWVTRHDISGEKEENKDKKWRDEKTLRDLYCGLGLTGREVGDILGCSHDCIHRWLNRNDIEIKDPKYRDWKIIENLRENDELTTEKLARRFDVSNEIIEKQHNRYQEEVINNGIPSRNKGPRTDSPWHDPDKLSELYQNKELSVSEIADRFDCSESTVRRWLNTFGIKSNEDKPWTNKNILEELYIDEEMTSEEVSQELDCSKSTIIHWLNKFDISRDEKPPLWRYEGVLRTLYLENDWTVKEIADELGGYKRTIRTWLNRHDINQSDTDDEDSRYRDENVMRRMYVDKEMSVTEISEKLDCHHSTISRWLARHNIQTRTPSDVSHRLIQKEAENNDQPYDNVEYLKHLYTEENMSVVEISRDLNCSQQTIRTRLHKFGLVKNDEETDEITLDQIDIDYPMEVPWRSEELMRKLYNDYDLTWRKIAEILDCSTGTVSNWIDNHGINTSDDVNRPSNLELRKMYVDNHLSGPEIARKLEVRSSTVYDWLREANIEVRGTGDYTHEALDNQDKLEELYIEKEHSVQEIARKLNSSHPTVKEALIDHGIEIRSLSSELSGEKHPLWKGGQEPYGKGWTEEKRENVLDRDEYCCQSCGKSNEDHIEKTGQSLHIHHINPAREYDDPEERNKMSNLVSMCSSCHSKWEGIPLRPNFTSQEDKDM